jgi:RHS repeat-associated protein
MNKDHYIFMGETMLDLFGLTRQSYIGKEKEPENNLGDHGVRKYDYETGRFNSIDPLFEKYYGWSPYQYSMNNPIWAKDWNGKVVVAADEASRTNIINSVESKYRDLIAFKDDGTAYLKENPKIAPLMKDLSNYSNIGALTTLINSEEIFLIKMGNEIDIKKNNGEVINWNLDTKGLESSGAFLPRETSKENNTSVFPYNLIVTNYNIYQNHLTQGQTKNSPGRNVAHELAHALLWYWKSYNNWQSGYGHDGKSGAIIREAEKNVDK